MEELKIPVYLEEDVLLYLQSRQRDADLFSIVNEILRIFILP